MLVVLAMMAFFASCMAERVDGDEGDDDDDGGGAVYDDDGRLSSGSRGSRVTTERYQQDGSRRHLQTR